MLQMTSKICILFVDVIINRRSFELCWGYPQTSDVIVPSLAYADDRTDCQDHC